MLTWRLRRSPTQWRWEPPSTCVFLEVPPDSRPADPTLPARHGPPVPQPLRAPAAAAAAAAGTSGPWLSGDAFRVRPPRPGPSPSVPCRPSRSAVVPALSSSKKVWVQRPRSGLSRRRPGPGGAGAGESERGSAHRPCSPRRARSVQALGLRFGCGLGRGGGGRAAERGGMERGRPGASAGEPGVRGGPRGHAGGVDRNAGTCRVRTGGK